MDFLEMRELAEKSMIANEEKGMPRDYRDDWWVEEFFDITGREPLDSDTAYGLYLKLPKEQRKIIGNRALQLVSNFHNKDEFSDFNYYDGLVLLASCDWDTNLEILK